MMRTIIIMAVMCPIVYVYYRDLDGHRCAQDTVGDAAVLVLMM